MFLVLKDTVITGKRVKAGQTVRVEGQEAKDLLAMGRISQAQEKNVETVDRSIGLNEETKPVKRSRARKSKS